MVIKEIKNMKIFKLFRDVPCIRMISNARRMISNARLRKTIIKYLEENGKTQDEKQALEYLKKNRLSVFIPDPSAKYNFTNIKVYIDEVNGLSYVMHHKKRLFFPEFMTIKEIIRYYRGLLIEQDPISPHYYFSAGAVIEDGDVVIDIGASEGIFAIDIVERANKVYLIEGDASWIRPLKETFAPWKDKVTIIHKYVSDVNVEPYATLDSLLIGEKVNFIKMDVEGFEERVLKGADALLSNERLTVVACAYHNQHSERHIRKILAEKGFLTSTSKGYMVFIYDEKLALPYLRRGLVIGKK